MSHHENRRAIAQPDLHPHQLRHTAKSPVTASGADVKVVQQMLGHSSATMTFGIYGHLVGDRLDGRHRDGRCPNGRPGPPGARVLLPGVAPVLPEPHVDGNVEEAPLSVFPPIRAPSAICTPDRIRTGATALRVRKSADGSILITIEN
jgi:hypothetical protein